MLTTSQRRSRRTAATVCSTLAIGIAGLAAAQGAQAAADGWSCRAGSGQGCIWARHSLVSVTGYSGSSGVSSGAGASTDANGRNLYGVVYQGAPSSCRIYSGNNLLYPIAFNMSGAPRTVFGGSSYGSGASGC